MNDKSDSSKEELSQKNLKTKDKDKPINNKYKRWVVTVLVLALMLSTCFSVVTELVYSFLSTNETLELIVAIMLVLIILVIAIIADVIGVAATSCDVQPFLAMASRKVKGAKRAVFLCKNSDKVSSIFADIIGDVCSIVSGASGATIAFILISDTTTGFARILISALVSAIIAAITIGGKALCKKLAIHNAERIVYTLAKLLSVFDNK